MIFIIPPCLRNILVVFICSVFVGASCTSLKSDKDNFKIAALLKSSTNPFFSLMWEGIRSESDRLGLQVELFWPESESNFDYQYDFLKNKGHLYDAIIIAPSNPEVLRQYLPGLKKKNILIALLDIDFDLPEHEKPKYYDVFIGTDDVLGGMLAAEYAKEHLPFDGGSIVLFNGFNFHKNIPRMDSFRKSLRLEYPNMTFTEFVGDYDRNKAKTISSMNLTAISKADIIYCANDHMALGVIDALKDRQPAHFPTIIGYDSVREAQEAILEGKLGASVIQFPAKMGRESVAALFNLFKGRTSPRRILIEPELSVQKSFITSLKKSDLLRDSNGN